MMKNIFLSFISVSLLFLTACKSENKTSGNFVTEQAEVQSFLDSYNTEYARLAYASALASWKTNTEIMEGDTMNAYNSRIADEALTAFTGSVENIENARKYLGMKERLTPLQQRQLEVILYYAGSDPQTVAEIVKEKIRASIAQTEKYSDFLSN